MKVKKVDFISDLFITNCILVDLCFNFYFNFEFRFNKWVNVAFILFWIYIINDRFVFLIRQKFFSTKIILNCYLKFYMWYSRHVLHISFILHYMCSLEYQYTSLTKNRNDTKKVSLDSIIKPRSSPPPSTWTSYITYRIHIENKARLETSICMTIQSYTIPHTIHPWKKEIKWGKTKKNIPST